MTADVYIYGLVRKRDGKMLYVGQTYYPAKRHSGLRKSTGLVILRRTNRKNALRIEAQVIRAYRRQGQCEKNRRWGSTGKLKKAINAADTVYCGFRVPKSLAEKIRALARLEQRSVSSQICQLLKNYLNEFPAN